MVITINREKGNRRGFFFNGQMEWEERGSECTVWEKDVAAIENDDENVKE